MSKEGILANYKYITDAKRRIREKRRKAVVTSVKGAVKAYVKGGTDLQEKVDFGLAGFDVVRSFLVDSELVEDIITAVNMGEITIPELIQLRKLSSQIAIKKSIRFALKKLGYK